MDWTALGVSLRLGVATIVVLLPLGIWLGRLLAAREFRGKLFVETLVTVPLVLPPKRPRVLPAVGFRQPVAGRTDVLSVWPVIR